MLNEDTGSSSSNANNQTQTCPTRTGNHTQTKISSKATPPERHREPLPVRIIQQSTPPTRHGCKPLSPDAHTTRPTIMATKERRPSSTRAPRPKYEEQQAFFIWYHRTDLGEAWNQVLREFERQFHHRRHKGGLQCKFYRLLKDWNVEKVRAQTKHVQDHPKDKIGAFGVVQRTSKRYEWMKPEHYNAPALPQFIGRGPSPSGSSCCSGCSDCG